MAFMEPCGPLYGICVAFVFFNYVLFALVIFCGIFYYKYYWTDDLSEIAEEIKEIEEEE